MVLGRHPMAQTQVGWWRDALKHPQIHIHGKHRRIVTVGKTSITLPWSCIWFYAWLCVFYSPAFSLKPQAQPPNVVLILADDLGYGDLGAYNPESRIPTPHLDRLADQGMRFTDAHSPSTVCTPTRYSILTGRMAFRTGFPGVFDGAGGPCLIESGRLTLPGMLRDQGYRTACYGKWHVGLTFFDSQGAPIHQNGLKAVQKIDYTRAIPDGPIHRGFDAFFGTACCPTTDWLYAYIDGDRVPSPPTRLLDRSPLPKHPYSRDNRPGMIADDFDLQKVDQVFLAKSQAFIRNHAQQYPEKPFFLFHSMQAVHLPSFASEAFQGKTQSGPHGDFIHEMDAIVGELTQTLKETGMLENTLILFTSDNGPEVPTVVAMRRDHQHDGARPWRGMKRDQWEGGHRVPFFAYWKNRIPAGTLMPETICLTDIMATVADLVGASLPEGAAEDSFNILPYLLEPFSRNEPIRPFTLHQTISLKLAIRKGPWKYLDHLGSGGNRYDRPNLKAFALPETAPEAKGQLYRLDVDPGETHNLIERFPSIAGELKEQLETWKKAGRSRPL